MASVIGKWKIEKSENFEEYMKAIGVSDQKRAEAHKFLSDGSGMTQEFSSNGDEWSVKSCTVSGEREFKITLGQPSDTFTLDGRPIKVVYSVDGDKLVETQTGEGFDCKHVRQGAGDTLTMTLTGNGVTCTRTFTKV